MWYLAVVSCNLERIGKLARPQTPASEDLDTGSTLAIEDHIVALKQEAGGSQRLHVLGTALDFIDLPTGTALEMMMMVLRGSLIARRLTGQLNLDEPPFFHESFEGT